ncbi:hypothetical protein SaSA16_1315 [Streptococcus agalactiae]|nr:hypothetical protein SaSA16_1315 [Streptococcus agalactiae]AUP08521.1 hypothetical protein SaSA159_1315 [Streptococcus agalactiae]AUP10105.1 hypothetical protein SaSA184_1320 [Streptococcus agalactiae]AUP11700.1 hypothetical protein SaSA191_1321 [Streptococcus agalactiae]AUP13294.1 hypothetical protein SaSA195_1322 [Streptococcus agalactiae]
MTFEEILPGLKAKKNMYVQVGGALKIMFSYFIPLKLMGKYYRLHLIFLLMLLVKVKVFPCGHQHHVMF